MKKTLSVILVLALIFSLAIPCSANSISDSSWSGVNVSPISPFDLMNQPVPYGVDPPNTTYNLHANTIYSFHGTASWSMLWLSQYMIGCTKYGVYIYNRSSEPLDFTVRGVSGGDQYFTLPGKTATDTYFEFSEMQFDVDTVETLFCITFDAPSDFEGWVYCAD